MKSNILRLLLVVLCTAYTAFAADKAPAKLETMVQNAMKGYNAGDAKVFFADISKATASIATPEIYKAMYEDPIKPKLGKFVSLAFVGGESSLNEETPLLIYTGKFEKGDAKISVNFIKEDAGMKIMQISIAPK